VDPLEDELRDLLTDRRHALPTDMVRMARVHAGASRRRRRRAVATSGAAVLLVALAGTGFAVLTNNHNGPQGTTVADRTPTDTAQPTTSGGRTTSDSPTTTTSGTAASTRLAWDGAQPVSLTATSTKTFVVLGQRSSSCGRTCLRLIESHDGGVTYDALPVPSDAGTGIDAATGTTASQVRFGSAVDGWLFHSGLWATHDGGITWSKVSMPGAVERLEAASGTVWALVSDDQGSQQLWSSPVASDSWKRVSGVSVTGPGDLSVQGKQVVVAGAQDSTTWSNASGTFARTASPCPGAVQVTLSGFDGVWAACASGNAGHLAYSADALHWSDVPLDLGQGALPNSLVVGAGAHQRATVGLPGDPGLVTLDAATGKILHQGQSGTGWSFVGFTDASVGYAISDAGGADQVLRTDDGGATWHPLTLG
jgi:hypothetical protein